MFIQLSQMITQANLSGIHLMVRPLGEGKISVVVATESDGFKADNPALKAALSQPLNVRGEVIQLDETFTQALDNFIESYTEHSVTSNDTEVTTAHSQAAKDNKPIKKTVPTIAEQEGEDEPDTNDTEVIEPNDDAIITEDGDDKFTQF